MRTTVDIPDPIYRRLKVKAASQGRSLKELILRAVEKELVPPQKRKRVDFPVLRSKEPGTLNLTNEQIYEIIPFP